MSVARDGVRPAPVRTESLMGVAERVAPFDADPCADAFTHWTIERRGVAIHRAVRISRPRSTR